VNADSAIAALAAPLANLLLMVLRAPVRALWELEMHLLLTDSRRAEYLADALAAETAGTPAVIGLHETLLLRSAYELVVQRSSATNERGDGLLDRLRAAFAQVPERERERRRRIARLEGSRLDSTHPPTGMRISLLERRGPEPARVTLDAAANERLEREIDALAPPLEREIVDLWRGRMYAG
jgi:Zn-dependent protease with chaperone function